MQPDRNRFPNQPLILILVDQKGEPHDLRKAGYIEPPPRMSPQTFRIVAHPFRYGPYQGEVPPAEQWFFTMADHDAI